ncbi:hypothetical protein K469DRAFT_706772 [Zopfia rhizophila CBS 207.26]|uniref:Uncharacterized protein n=1 Tax=Zopfia rhizophila CBS 207.26 TaxID=1314779 RepID=A0A6A6E6K2_9PEZI|nr:hypothetical protein K469DRAFT_706772 [Zopfia rhizophila CBS 207.26]
MATLLNITRLHNAMFAVVYWGGGLLGFAETASTAYTASDAPYQAKEWNSAAISASNLCIDVETTSLLLRIVTPITKIDPAHGTTNFMADDALRVLKSRRDGLATIWATDRWLEASLAVCIGNGDVLADFLRLKWDKIKERLREKSVDELKLRGREPI